MDYIIKTDDDNTNANSSGNKVKNKISQESILFDIATKNRTLYYDLNRVAYIEVQDIKQFQSINSYLIKIASSEFEDWLTTEYFERCKKLPFKQSVIGIKTVLVKKARLDGKTIKLHNRLAYVKEENAVYLDLGTIDRKMVRIDSKGWNVGCYPVYFKRHDTAKALPYPVQGGDINHLFQFLPSIPRREACLALSWLIASFFDHIERPFLLLEGPHGMGKTTLAKLLKGFIDPDTADAIQFNDNLNEVAQIIDQHCIPHFDNLTLICRNVSDMFCTAFSGGTHIKKKLYTDDSSFTFQLSGNAIFTTLGLRKPKGDFLDRCYKITFQKSNDAYRSKAMFLDAFQQIEPSLFGAILDIVSLTMKNVHDTPVLGRYRTVDFDRYASTAAEIMGFGKELFWEARAYSESIKLKSMVDNTPLIEALTNFLQSRNHTFSGYMGQLVKELPQHTALPDDLPKQANVLARRIGEIDGELRQAGIIVTKQFNDRNGAKYGIQLVQQQAPVADQKYCQEEIPSDSEVVALGNLEPTDPLVGQRECEAGHSTTLSAEGIRSNNPPDPITDLVTYQMISAHDQDLVAPDNVENHKNQASDGHSTDVSIESAHDNNLAQPDDLDQLINKALKKQSLAPVIESAHDDEIGNEDKEEDNPFFMNFGKTNR